MPEIIGGRKDMKSKLGGKFGFTLLITCLLVLACSTPHLRFDQLTKTNLDKIAGKDWQLFYTKEPGKGESPIYYYYNRPSLSYPSEKIVRVWRKQIFSGAEGTILSLSYLFDIDCSDRRYHIIDTDLVPNVRVPDEKIAWHNIEPKSVDESLYKTLCR